MLRKIKEICQNAELTTFNKANITVTVSNGRFIPASCRKDSREQCLNELHAEITYKMNDFNLNQELLDLMRKKVDHAYYRWKDNLLQKIKAANRQFTISDKKIAPLLNYLNQLKDLILLAKVANKMKGGNCGEINALALNQILQEALSYNERPDIRGITLTNEARDNNHYFLLINSNLPDIKTIAGKEKIAEFFSTYSNGYICDPWNKGIFTKIKHEQSGLYFNNDEWHEITIEDYAPPMDALAKLPCALQEVFQQEFIALGVMQAESPLNETKKVDTRTNAPVASVTLSNFGFFDRAIQHVGNYARSVVEQCPAYFPASNSIMHGHYWKENNTTDALGQHNEQCAIPLRIGQ